jgi:LAO/AO transport system kinase
VLDAASRDPILVETVGVGQDEIDIVKLADVSVVVLVPGMGDDIQALKAGIMEIGDIFVINKCDRPGVENMERAVLSLLSLAHRPDGLIPPIIKTICDQKAAESKKWRKLSRKAVTTRQGSSLRTERKRGAARQPAVESPSRTARAQSSRKPYFRATLSKNYRTDYSP